MAKPSSARPTPLAIWLAETVRLSEERWGPYEDAEIVRRVRHEAGGAQAAVVARNTALARREHLDDVARRWRDNAILAAVLAALFAVASGVAAGMAGLGDGSRPVNLFWALGGLLGIHALTLLLWLLGLLWGSRLGSAIGRLLLAMAGRLSRIPALAAAGERAAAARPPAAALVPRALLGLLQRAGLTRWLAGAVTHAWWLLALVCAFATLVAMLSTRRYGFVWETTLLSPETFVALTAALGWLPSMLGFPMPDAELVRASDGLQALGPEAHAVWSGWLLGCVLVYGIVPRALLLSGCTVLAYVRRNRFALDMSLPSFILLRERLAPVSERLGVTDAAPPSVAAAAGPASAYAAADAASAGALAPGLAAGMQRGDARVVLGVELPEGTPWPPPGTPRTALDAGVVDTRRQRNALLELFVRHTPARLLIVCDGAQTPDRGTMGLVAELARSAAQARVWLHGEPTETRRTQWHDRLQAAGLAAQALAATEADATGWLTDAAPARSETSHE